MKTTSLSQNITAGSLPRRAFLRLSLMGSVAAGAYAACAMVPTQARLPAIKIKQLNSEEAYAKMSSCMDRGDEAGIGVLLGILIAISLSKYGWDWDTEKCEIRRRFFTRPRIHRILTAIKTGEADDKTRLVINKCLGERGPGWPSAMAHYRQREWFKERILECFEPTCFPKHVSHIAHCVPLSLDEVIQHPLRDPFV